MSLINREALYEKACDLEAQALSYVEKIVNDETRTDEWRIWSAVLAERTAFKHDIFDAPEVVPEPKWIHVSERLPEDGQNVLVTYKTTDKIHPCQYHDDGSRNPWYSYIDQCRVHMNVVSAWMPLPEPYREEGGQE